VFIAGQLQSFAYDPSAARFDLQASSAPVRSRSRVSASVIFVPSAVTASIGASGARLRVVSRRAGGRLAYAWPTGGAYRVFTK
jgi:hypothetical protein